MRPAHVPVNPSPDQARTWLGEELSRPEYHRDNLLQRLLAWIEDMLSAAHDVSVGAGPWRTLAALAVFLLLAGLVIWLLTRLRRARGTRRSQDQPALMDQTIGAAEWRRRAEAALGAGDWDTAVVDGFRAVCARALETEEITAGPGATADELARLLAEARPAEGPDLTAAAGWFDDVLYGDRPATRERAEGIVALDRTRVRR